MKEAMFYRQLQNKDVQCNLCPRNCLVKENKTGFCRVRKNIDSKLYSLVFSKPCSVNVDSIMKKPLFHFAIDTQCLSISTVGCNLDCKFCQNWEISHPDSISGEDIPPEKVIEIVKDYNLPGIAYTYTEPTVFYEYCYEIMKLAKKAGLYNIWVSNGYTNPEPARKISRYLDAINVDLKGDMNFYQKLCSVPNEEPMHSALKIYKENNVWIEITNLIIPGYNDKPEQIKKLVLWVKNNLGNETPLHFSRFHPCYKLLKLNPTPMKTLEKAIEIAKNMKMHYVYLGNVHGHKNESTYCYNCNEKLIDRRGHEIISFKEKCPKCGTNIKIGGKKWNNLK